MKKRTTWTIKNKKDDFAAICREQGICEVTARVLVNRGLATEQERTAFLHPDARYLFAPEQLKNAKKAAEMLREDVLAENRIRIIGDYDVDGIVSTYILYKTLKAAGAAVDYCIPDRIKDGYGINNRMVEEAVEAGVRTILTCDNGIVAGEPVALAKAAGLRVVLTDHHDIPTKEEDGNTIQILPDADVIVNPKQDGETAPYRGLCGAVVAYKVMQLFAKGTLPEAFMEGFLPYAALATVCDVMDLTGENRLIAAVGIQRMRQMEDCGLNALIEENHLNKEKIGTYHLGFVLGPCLNASGRLDAAIKGLELLLSETPEQAKGLALELTELNSRRKDMTLEGVRRAAAQIEQIEEPDRVLVLYLPECHESLAGIIAGKIKETYYRPTIVLTDAEDGSLKGSGRSIEAYSMFQSLLQVSDLFTKFGGHPMAAGMSLPKEKLEELRRRLNEQCTLSEADMTEKYSIDVYLPFRLVTERVIRELRQLEPFGRGNEKPLFAERKLRVLRAFVFGKNANVLKLQVQNEFGCRFDALYFGDIPEFEQEVVDAYGKEQLQRMYEGRENTVLLSIIYYPEENEYRGTVTLQAVISHYRMERG